MRSLGDAYLSKYDESPGKELQKAFHGFNTLQRTGRSVASKKRAQTARHAFPSEVVEHGRWRLNRSSLNMPLAYLQWSIDTVSVSRNSACRFSMVGGGLFEYRTRPCAMGYTAENMMIRRVEGYDVPLVDKLFRRQKSVELLRCHCVAKAPCFSFGLVLERATAMAVPTGGCKLTTDDIYYLISAANLIA
jgi:hypothetical protein